MEKCVPITRHVLSLLLGAALAVSLLPAASAADSSVPSSVSSRNIHAQDYTTYGKTVKSYLYANSSGGLTRVEYADGKIIVEDYDGSFQLAASREIPMELSIWGGFYAGADSNFFIFGQKNPSESNSTEVIRVVKYSKDWQRQGQASLEGANTTVPFDAGSLRCDEYGGYLYIRTCHEMYTSSDGLNHQSNLTMAIRQSDMSITDSFYDVMNTSVGYVSHSFNQYIIVDEGGKIVTLDHGDAYDRGVIFMKYYADAGTGTFSGEPYGRWCSCGNMKPFAGNIGDNTTGASIGGLAETSTHYIFAYSYDGKGGTGARQPFFHYMDKETGKSWSVPASTTVACSTPVLAPMGLTGGYILWNDKEGYTIGDTLYYRPYSEDGTLGDTKTAAAPLSDCQPIPYNGKAVWYVTDNSTPVFYGLDDSGVTVLGDGSSSGTPSASEPSQPGTTTTGTPSTGTKPSSGSPASSNIPIPFSDVSEDSWFRPYVQAAYAASLVSGTSPTTYSPDSSLTLAEAVTLAARIYAENHKESVPTGGSPWYKAAYDYCVSKKVLDASTFPLSSMTNAATRFEMAAILDGAIPAERMDNSVTVSSIPDIQETDKYGAMVYRWYRAGIVAGDKDGSFNGNRAIKRSEVAKILCLINKLV